jgi:peptidoglycan hydrolase CwlO-like protein
MRGIVQGCLISVFLILFTTAVGYSQSNDIIQFKIDSLKENRKVLQNQQKSIQLSIEQMDNQIKQLECVMD